jgi:hypothetical protein
MDSIFLKYNLMEISSPDNNLGKAFLVLIVIYYLHFAFLFPVITILFSLDEINETVNLSYILIVLNSPKSKLCRCCLNNKSQEY